MALDATKLKEWMESTWEKSCIPVLKEYITIPNQSPAYDPEWETNGLQDKAIDVLMKWVDSLGIKGMKHRIVREPKRTPLILMEIAGTCAKPETILMYGHMDKQPPMMDGGWFEGYGPYKPVVKDGKLYGRGASDDGYAIFTALTSIKALQDQGVTHDRIVITVEASEESGSPDLPYYIEKFKEEIGVPKLIVCLDSGCGDYDALWLTTTLRGVCIGTLKVKMITEAVHSGSSGGVIPSTFRIARHVLNRIENSETGEVLLKELWTDIPKQRLDQTKATAEKLGAEVHTEFPFLKGSKPVHSDPTELLLNRSWRPALAVTGADGFPSVQNAGNITRTHTHFKLSMRIPPHVNPEKALQAMKKELERDPPYGASVVFDITQGGWGWEAPKLDKWLETSLEKASNTYFGSKVGYMGEGGSIPFMQMLSNFFPEAQFVIVGVLGPKSNAHGPNEFLELPFTKKLTCCMSQLLADHCTHYCH